MDLLNCLLSLTVPALAAHWALSAAAPVHYMWDTGRRVRAFGVGSLVAGAAAMVGAALVATVTGAPAAASVKVATLLAALVVVAVARMLSAPDRDAAREFNRKRTHARLARAKETASRYP